MQKKIIALAVAGLMSGAAFAQSNVTIYGVMHGSMERISQDSTGLDRLYRVTSNTSRIGFKGTEALGNGLNLNWQIENGINLDNGAAGAWNNRNTWIGLSNAAWGEFRLGNHDTAHKMATGRLDIMGDTIGDYNNIIGTASGGTWGEFDRRAANGITYLSPVFNGLQFTANVSAANEAGNDTATVSNTNPSLWSAALTYNNGPLFAALAYEAQRVGDNPGATAVAGACWDNSAGAVVTVAAAGGCTAAGDFIITPAVTAGAGAADDYKLSSTKLGVGYNFGATNVGFIYERMNDDSGKTARDRNAWGMNVAHTMGNVVLKAQYLRAGDSDRTGLNDGARNIALVADYNFSKRTTGYVAYSKTSNDRDARYALGTWQTNANAGKDPSAVAVGLKHAF